MAMKIKLWTLILSTALIEILFLSPQASAQKPKEESVVKDGSVVSLEYTLSDEKGKPLESNKGKEPLKYIHGQKQIIPGLEKELSGMKVGGEKHVQVKPEEAYGVVNPKAFQEVPKEKIPPDGLKVGATLMAKSPQGQSQPVRVAEIKEKTVVLDLNHPLAGKTLTFDVKVLDIQSPQSTPPQPAPQAK
ncbi:MAG: peptidylprolyl isomerase [Deltaproteobacteria bacterium]|nr:MAG: peptidylprolyl isomerase [Deltaproteobacteria bacterium]